MKLTVRCRRAIVLCLAGFGLLVSAEAQAEPPRVIDSMPKAGDVVDGRSVGYFVRFDRPIDHLRSSLSITREGKLVETLTPRADSAPEVLFARAAALPPGDYKLHWQVKTMGGADTGEGEISFKMAR